MDINTIIYPRAFIDAHNVLSGLLSKGVQISVGNYGDILRSPCEIRDYDLQEVPEDEEEAEGSSNILLKVTYKQKIISNGGAFTAVDVHRNLLLLRPDFDSWSYNLKMKVWDGSFPSTIALDEARGELLIVKLHTNRIELITFGDVSPKQLTRLDLLDTRNPYRIMLDYDALLSYVDESERLNHLRNTLYIELNTDVPLRVNNLLIPSAEDIDSEG